MANLLTETLAYPGAEGPIQAFLARPEADEPRPAVIVIHEIFGLTDHIRQVTARLAGQGYVAFAPDLYSRPGLAGVMVEANIRAVMRFAEEVGHSRLADAAAVEEALGRFPPEQAEGIRDALPHMFAGTPRFEMVQDLARAVDFLNAQPYVSTEKVASVGFCFGGGMSLRLACNTRLAACVVFYGENPEQIELINNIAGPVMGLYGAEDARVNAHLHELVGAMARYQKPFEMKIYPGAGHAFFNDTSLQRYRPGAAADAWERLLRFLKENLDVL